MKEKITLGPCTLGEAPLVVGVISSARTIEHPPDFRNLPFDVAEYRVDLFGADEPGWLEQASAMNASGAPVIVTARSASEGGHWYLNEEERVAVYRAALPFVAAIDVEIRSEALELLAHEAHAGHKVVIGSFHDFERTPDVAALREIVRIGRAKGADIVKIAALANDEADVARLAGLLDERAGGLLCVLGMGAVGGASRVALARCGSCLTYGFFDDANAPGQFSSAELRERLLKKD